MVAVRGGRRGGLVGPLCEGKSSPTFPAGRKGVVRATNMGLNLLQVSPTSHPTSTTLGGAPVASLKPTHCGARMLRVFLCCTATRSAATAGRRCPVCDACRQVPTRYHSQGPCASPAAPRWALDWRRPAPGSVVMGNYRLRPVRGVKVKNWSHPGEEQATRCFAPHLVLERA